MFQKTSLRLAGLYLLIIMLISLFFSVNVYHLSTQEFDRGFTRQEELIQHLPPFGISGSLRDQLIDQRQKDINEAKDRIITRLIITNLLILVGGGFVSYYLARRSLRPIEEAHEAQSRFTADASHELRTPIAAMQTEIEVALMKPKLKLSEAKDQLSSNLEELHQLNKLTEGLLHLSRLDHRALRGLKVPLEQIVNSAVTRILPTAEAKRVLINTQLAEGVVVDGDESSLIEMLVIILDNAVKYSPPKSEVQLTTSKLSHSVIITVSDHGVGIKPSELTHIFERFYRADSARSKDKVVGFGLGLAIADNIIKLHNGSIEVKSKVSKGSEFKIILPVNN